MLDEAIEYLKFLQQQLQVSLQTATRRVLPMPDYPHIPSASAPAPHSCSCSCAVIGCVLSSDASSCGTGRSPVCPIEYCAMQYSAVATSWVSKVAALEESRVDASLVDASLSSVPCGCCLWCRSCPRTRAFRFRPTSPQCPLPRPQPAGRAPIPRLPQLSESSPTAHSLLPSPSTASIQRWLPILALLQFGRGELQGVRPGPHYRTLD